MFVDAKTDSLKELMSFLLDYCDSFSFVIRKDEVSEHLLSVIAEFKSFHIQTKEVSEWPGTILHWDQAFIYYYQLNKESAQKLSDTENNLFRWLHPRLPEDLIFYKNDKPVLISTSHETDAYFDKENVDENYLWLNNLID
jgi:hypothetical protein